MIYSKLAFGTFLFFALWLHVVFFVKCFTLDSDTIIPTDKFMTKPLIISGLVILVAYLFFAFHLIVRHTS